MFTVEEKNTCLEKKWEGGGRGKKERGKERRVRNRKEREERERKKRELSILSCRDEQGH